MSDRTQNIILWGFDFALLFVMSGITFFALMHFDRSFIIGHDEAVYATKARSWLIGTPADQFESYRPFGVPLFTWIFLHFGDSESALRLFGIIFGAFVPVAVYALFRQVCDLWVSLSVALVAAGSYIFFEQSPRLLDDVPSTVLLIAVMALLLAYYRSQGKSNLIYLAPPIAALAFYLRYGSATPLAVMGLFSYLLLLPRFLQLETPHLAKIGKSILLGTLLFVPHFIYSIIETGSPLGILQLAGKAAHRVYLGEGLVQYLNWLPKYLGGWMMGLTAILGTFILIFFILTPLREKYLGLTWIGAIGFVTFFLNGILVHAESRYVFFSMILLSGVGIAGSYHLISKWSRLVATTLLGVVWIVGIYFGILHFQELQQLYWNEDVLPSNVAYIRALQIVQTQVGGGDCEIWTALDRPRASWYAECFTPKIADRNTFLVDMNAHPGATLYSIVDSHVSDPQIRMENANAFGAILTEIYRDVSAPGRFIIVYRITVLQ